MSEVAAKYPSDWEASIFHALSLAASALPDRQDVRESAESRRASRTVRRQTTGSSGTHPLPHPQLRRPPLANRAMDAARRHAEHRTRGAPRPAHAVPHLYPAGAWQATIETNIAADAASGRARLNGRGAPRARLRDVCLSPDRAGQRGCAHHRRHAARDRRRVSIRMQSVPRRPALPASLRSPPFPPVMRSSAARGATRRSSCRSRADIRMPTR